MEKNFESIFHQKKVITQKFLFQQKIPPTYSQETFLRKIKILLKMGLR